MHSKDYIKRVHFRGYLLPFYKYLKLVVLAKQTCKLPYNLEVIFFIWIILEFLAVLWKAY